MVDPDVNFLKIDGSNENYELLKDFPEWSFHGPRYPEKEAVLRQFEQVVKAYPKINFIGAHFLELAENLSELERMLNAYPNLYVDFSARAHQLGRQPYAARRFFITYQDRILFGSDGHYNANQYRQYYRFLETDDEYFEQPLYEDINLGRWRIYGLYLPDEALAKIYYKNASKILNINVAIQ